MYRVCRAKYLHHPELCVELLSTGDLEIRGAPSTWQWKEWNGRIQTRLREEILLSRSDGGDESSSLTALVASFKAYMGGKGGATLALPGEKEAAAPFVMNAGDEEDMVTAKKEAVRPVEDAAVPLPGCSPVGDEASAAETKVQKSDTPSPISIAMRMVWFTVVSCSFRAWSVPCTATPTSSNLPTKAPTSIPGTGVKPNKLFQN